MICLQLAIIGPEFIFRQFLAKITFNSTFDFFAKSHFKQLITKYLTALVLRPYIYGYFFSMRYHNTSCTVVHLLAWNGQPWPSVRTLDTKPRGIMCLLVGVAAKVQAPRRVAFQWLVLCSSFCGCGSSNLEPPTMGIAVAMSSIAAAINLRWW